ncbi:MAG: SUMF1/EgtB/PvdO family nonheme iron enzyme [Elusimicrobiota bacterium]
MKYIKNFVYVILVLIITICTIGNSQESEEVEEKLRLAILDLGAKDVSAMTASKVSELLRTAMFNTGLFTIIERNEMEAILKEQKLTLTGCIDEKCGLKIGQLLSANKILVGTVMKLGEKIIINARIVDVEKGALDFAEKTSCTKESEIDIACDEFANKLSARITGRPYQPSSAGAGPSGVIPSEAKKYEGMDLIPAGEFTMGSDRGESDEKPPHKVYLDAYYIDKYEVTFEQYDKFCEATGRKKPSDSGWGRGTRPVINVNWNDAVAYANYYGKRLPTEAEWEKACRSGSETKYCFGDSKSELGEYGWYSSNSGGWTHPVGSKKPNRWGLYDMHGNVWEWCSDWYDGGYYKNSPYRNPKGPGSGTYRVLRGGSWINNASNCRSTDRGGSTPGIRSDYGWGFRCAVGVVQGR